MGRQHWWIMVALCAAMTLPLLYPAIPPLVDVPGHMGRYRVMLAIAEVPALARNFEFHWRLIGNLGADLLIIPLAAVFGIELGTKLIVIAIVAVTGAGMLWLAREVHGRVPPTALFALPLVYGFPFQFGFLNFVLSIALVFPALALWVRLARLERFALRAAIFVVVAALIWVTHTVGWGLLGVAAFGIEIGRRRAGGAGWRPTLVASVVACLPLALPALALLLTSSGAPEAASGGWFNPAAKLYWVLLLLADRWAWFDAAGLAVLVLVVFVAVREPRWHVSPQLAWPAALSALVYLAMPSIAQGSHFADMRLLPFTFALLLLAVRVDGRAATVTTWLGAGFFGARIAAATVSFALYDASFSDELRAIDHIPREASVLVLDRRACVDDLTATRFDHLGSMAIVRRDAFVNDQWTLEGAQLMRVRKPGLGDYATDPSQHVTDGPCVASQYGAFDIAITRFNRAAFDYVWTLGFPPGRAHAADLTPVWTNGHSALYRVSR